jgi:hypothetical protein
MLIHEVIHEPSIARFTAMVGVDETTTFPYPTG